MRLQFSASAVALILALAGPINTFAAPAGTRHPIQLAQTAPASAPTRIVDASAAHVPPAAAASTPLFQPPSDSAIPDNDFGKEVRLGQAIFNGTSPLAAPFVGNSLRCASCHLDAGRLPHSAPLWSAYLMYPAYRSKNKHVNTLAERMQGCFSYSMNGKAPPLGDKVLVALESYAFFLAKGAPVGVKLAGGGYPTPPKPALAMDFNRGAQVFEQKCALCHGADGLGQTSDGAVVFPPLWGPKSFNWGAGMGSIKNAAGFIKANMPLSRGNTLSDQEAWDVAMFMDSHERPQDPRFKGSIAETREQHHDEADDMYGQSINGQLLGIGVPPPAKVRKISTADVKSIGKAQ
jgi:thiosulfate dehydrogenase